MRRQQSITHFLWLPSNVSTSFVCDDVEVELFITRARVLQPILFVCQTEIGFSLSFSFLWMANQDTEQCSIDLLIDTWPMLTIVPVGRWTASSFCWFCLIGEKGNSTSSLIWFWFHTRKSHNLRTNNTNAQRTIETHIFAWSKADTYRRHHYCYYRRRCCFHLLNNEN